MLAFSEWVKLKKKKERKDERYTSQVGGEIRNQNDEGEVTGSDSQVSAQRVFVFAVPEF